MGGNEAQVFQCERIEAEGTPPEEISIPVTPQMYWQIQKIATGLNITPTQLCADLLVSILNQKGVYSKGYETPALYEATIYEAPHEVIAVFTGCGNCKVTNVY
ncbi:MAG: hypothetical protein PHQ76_02940 [Caldisericia bacterium]|nr:hypothetical protein [Caldisericia bacterium]